MEKNVESAHAFTKATELIGHDVRVTMDRPLGTAHPKHGWTYPINYGFIPETLSPDGEELDAYVLGIAEPLATFEGTCIAAIRRTNDQDDKCVVVPKGITMTDEEIRAATDFQERFFTSDLLR